MSGSKIRLYGSTSGYVELEAPAVAPDGVLTLPSTFAGIGSNVVSTIKTDSFSTATTGSFVNVTGLNATITPTSASSKILVIVNVKMSNSGGTVSLSSDLLRDATVIGAGSGGTANAFGYDVLPSSSNMRNFTICILDSPATASAVTYQVRVRGETGTTYVNRRGLDTFAATSSDITAIEVAA